MAHSEQTKAQALALLMLGKHAALCRCADGHPTDDLQALAERGASGVGLGAWT